MTKNIQCVSDPGAGAEAQLIQACAQNQSAWEDQLISWLGSDGAWLNRRCTALLGNSADAEDAVQEITFKVIRGIAGFEGRSSLRTWVIRIADNHCYSLIKKRYSHVVTDHLQYCIALVEADRYSEEVSDYSEQTTEQVRSILQRLTSINREILELRFFNELSIRQISTKLELTQSATKMRLYRAMNVFKLKFQKLPA